MMISDRVADTGGRPSGFDYMRIVLALVIVIFHSTTTSYGSAGDWVWWNTPAKPFIRLLLPAFFALSGFLVASSLERSKTLISFLGLRVIRIYPALAVETLLSAFILGPLATTFTLGAYFTSPLFFSYLLNVLGDVHYALPGVFLQNPHPVTVNGQLWTVPFELLCYISLAALTVLGLRKKRIIAPLATVASIVGFVIAKAIKYHGLFPVFDTALSGPLLVSSFLAGVTIYLYRDRIPWNIRWMGCSAVASILLLGVIPYGEYLAPIPAAYFTIYVGLTNPPRVGLLRSADYSYGVFLYSYAIQQMVCGTFPWARHWYANILICVPLSLVVAAISWRFVEKPALGLRGLVMRLDKRFSPQHYTPELVELAKRPA
ncbi:MAG: acyltransferase family protein [Caulobacteraceae bacterium]|nr:acyltransferase family protein [Caulobacteraceae bacterium]